MFPLTCPMKIYNQIYFSFQVYDIEELPGGSLFSLHHCNINEMVEFILNFVISLTVPRVIRCRASSKCSSCGDGLGGWGFWSALFSSGSSGVSYMLIDCWNLIFYTWSIPVCDVLAGLLQWTVWECSYICEMNPRMNIKETLCPANRTTGEVYHVLPIRRVKSAICPLPLMWSSRIWLARIAVIDRGQRTWHPSHLEIQKFPKW